MIHNPIRKALPDLSNPGAADDLRSGKQLVGADGSIVTGNLPEVTQATPTISVSSGGLITASATQSGGIVEAGSKGSTQQLTTQGEKTVTPTTTNQTAVASGRYTTGDVVVAGDANLVPENIAEGVTIFDVTGTHSGGGGELVTGRDTSAFFTIYYANDLGYHVLSGGSEPFQVYKNSLIVIKATLIEAPAIDVGASFVAAIGEPTNMANVYFVMDDFIISPA